MFSEAGTLPFHRIGLCATANMKLIPRSEDVVSKNAFRLNFPTTAFAASLALGVAMPLMAHAAGTGDKPKAPDAAQPAAAAQTTAPTVTPAQPADVSQKGKDGAVPETVQSGPKVTVQQHGDWLLECYDPAINNVNCQIKQRIAQKDTDRNILVMSIAFDPKAKSNVIQYVLPLDFLLTPGVSIEVGSYQSTAGVNRCSVQGCFVEGTTDDAFIKALQGAKDGGRVVIVSRTGQKVGIGFSAAGFSKAYDEMVKENTRMSAQSKG
ncbi:invasion associated locus B family protein [Rhizobium sp. CSW-27]|uniref:invasion associated locus B family protein n=1 Tax=Rhizobium sp. CSW-27 TaxID=2839985 RepID=UPI001C036F71|nr:invasion associated locus B family protein [Rhizobium sp. CSW-27]MBT9372213.1 invasion associated locus B family protein [Rhizobium sp. CSW-27]